MSALEEELKNELEALDTRLTELESVIDVLGIREEIKLVKTVLDNFFGYILKKQEITHSIGIINEIQAFRDQLRGK